MSQLESVTLSFDGKDYTVDKEDGIWGLIEAIENVITFFELAPAFSTGRYPSARIFRAYAVALNYAGAKVTPDELRKASDYRRMGSIAGSLAAILDMGQPGADVDLGGAKGSDKDVAKAEKKVAKSS
jgi:hypothetical protein